MGEETAAARFNSNIMNMDMAAAYLTISKATLYMLVKAKMIPYAPVGKRILFRRDDLYNWVGSKVVDPVYNILGDEEEDELPD
ncbi:excisionase family DNA-binding protein [Treponema sp. C6A8]|uniref:excisionase family DNA-binding protein n=1 Tax=Treponema sp. C6A8 TaxID=1410609 RepID=UPI0004886422|nr:helix-turn-helix domain-containing protein [Treponema sp. C6A8]